MVSVMSPFCFLLYPFLSPFLLVIVIVCVLSPFCLPFSPVLSPFLVVSGHCVRFVSLCFLLSPFLSVIVSVLSPFLLMSQKVALGMLRCCLTCLGSTVV